MEQGLERSYRWAMEESSGETKRWRSDPMYRTHIALADKPGTYVLLVYARCASCATSEVLMPRLTTGKGAPHPCVLTSHHLRRLFLDYQGRPVAVQRNSDAQAHRYRLRQDCGAAFERCERDVTVWWRPRPGRGLRGRRMAKATARRSHIGLASRYYWTPKNSGLGSDEALRTAHVVCTVVIKCGRVWRLCSKASPDECGTAWYPVILSPRETRLVAAHMRPLQSARELCRDGALAPGCIPRR